MIFKNLKKPACLWLFFAALLPIFALPASAAASQGLLSFSTTVSPPMMRSSETDYTVDQGTAKFWIYIPANYTPSDTFGLIVYVSPSEQTESLPDGWADVLARHKLLFIVPQNAGNHTNQRQRQGLAVLAALQMMRNYRVDPKRVYAAGLSGGARTACNLGLTQSDIFVGTIQDCGANFYKDVPVRYATSSEDTLGHHYGVSAVSPQELASARSRVKFVLITGSGDFRRGNILDIYNGGFATEGFRCKLIDVSGMGHQDCDAKTLEQALEFLK